MSVLEPLTGSESPVFVVETNLAVHLSVYEIKIILVFKNNSKTCRDYLQITSPHELKKSVFTDC